MIRCRAMNAAWSDARKPSPSTSTVFATRRSSRRPTRRRRCVASTHPGAPRRRHSFGWCRTICSVCRRSTTTASRVRPVAPPQSRQAAPRLLSLSPPPARRARTVTAAIRTLTGERDLAVGIVLRLGAGGRSPFATRLAQCCARNPVALERLMHGRTAKAVTYRSDKSDGFTAGTETVDPLVELPDSRGESGDRLTHRHDVDRACGPP